MRSWLSHMGLSSLFFSCEHLSSQDKNFRASHVSKAHTQGITDTSICNFTSPGCLPEILVPSSSQGKEANTVSLLQQNKRWSSKGKCGWIPSDTTKLETVMTVGSTNLISPASRVWVTRWSDRFGYQVMQQILNMQRDKYFSTHNCCSSHWESQGGQAS